MNIPAQQNRSASSAGARALSGNSPYPRIADLFENIDAAWLLIGAAILLIALILPSYWWHSITFTAGSLWGIAPYLLLSASIAGYLEAADADQLIGRVFSERIFFAIAAAAVFGALSPFCSCGVIPLIAALLLAGVPLAAVMAFWVASPIMSPSMFVVTSAGIGLEFALVKLGSAVAVGLTAGAATLLMQHLGFFRKPLRELPATGCKGNPFAAVSGNPSTVWRVWQHPERLRVWRQKTFAMALFLGKWLTLAFLLESLMVIFLSAEVLGPWVGSESGWGIPLAALIGVPAYLNGFAAVPVVAGLIDAGMSQPAALTFMLAGAMTSLPAAIAVFSLVRRPLFIWYVAQALIGAIAAGWAYQFVLLVM